MSCFECIMHILNFNKNIQSYDPLETASTCSNISEQSEEENEDWDICSQ